MKVYERPDVQARAKEDRSPLTDADIASDDVLRAALEARWPGVPVVSEESESALAARDAFFLVDPLDGTKEFLSRNGEFTVNVALVVDARPVAGVVHAPALGLTFYGDVEGGSFRQQGQGPRAPIRTRSPGKPLLVVGSRSHPSPEMDGFLAQLPPHEFVGVGSSLKLCRVADASADLYPRFGPTMPWDIAAGHAVLEAAGGVVETLDGRPLRYQDVAAKNPAFIAAGDPAWRALLVPRS